MMMMTSCRITELSVLLNSSNLLSVLKKLSFHFGFQCLKREVNNGKGSHL